MAGYMNEKKRNEPKVYIRKTKISDNLEELTYVKQAERVVSNLPNKNGKIMPTTNKIRNMLTLIGELYNKARYAEGNKLDEEIQSHAQYVKMRLVYEAGRDKDVKILLEESGLLGYLDKVGDSKKELIRLCRYMEALVAYHKYNTTER